MDKKLEKKIMDNAFCGFCGLMAIAFGVTLFALGRSPSNKKSELEPTAIYERDIRACNEDIDGNGKYETVLYYETEPAYLGGGRIPVAQIYKDKEGSIKVIPFFIENR